MRDILDDLLTSNQPFHSDVSLTRARAALARLSAGNLSPSERSASPGRVAAVETLRRVHAESRAVSWHRARAADAPCPACTDVWITLARASRHVPHCPHHPALGRLEAAADALRLRAGADPDTRALLDEADALLDARAPHDAPFPYLPEYEVEGALARVASADARLTEKEAALLEALVADWSSAYHPEADPCPSCGAVTPLAERLPHLLACPWHPAALLADRLEDALHSRVGAAASTPLLAAFARRNALRDALRLLVQGCVHYEAEWGFHDHGVYYSKRYIELPWRYDVERAERLLQTPTGEASGERSPEIERLGAEAARWRAALGALWTASVALWSCMGDGDLGKSLIPEGIVPPWRDVIEAAKAVMAHEGVPLWKSYGGGLRATRAAAPASPSPGSGPG